MLKRQDSLLSSSRRQTPPPPEKTHAKSVGCMSGIFQLISKYQNRRKLLTLGRKHEKKEVSRKSSAREEKYKIVVLDDVQNLDSNKRLSTEMVHRSPVLSQKIRLPNAGNNPPALVARLMGLEPEQPAVAEEKRGVYNEEESSEEKRLRLLKALEKCNEDLEALKKIIIEVQSCEKDLQSQPLITNKVDQMKSEGMSLNSPLRNYHKLLHPNGNLEQQNKKMVVKKPGEEDDHGMGISFLNRVQTESFRIKRKATTTPSFWSSKAMIQSVDEVCNDIAWGENREIGNIGQILQNQIFKDLVEEFTKELSYHCMHTKLPFEACKRRLSF